MTLLVEPMTEHDLTTRLVRVLRTTLAGYVIFKHADAYNFGLPDLSVTGEGITSWWEIKHANPDVKSRGIQYETCSRMAQAGVCHYIIFAEQPQQRVIIIPPRHLEDWEEWQIGVPTFDYAWVATYIQSIHRRSTGLPRHE